MALDNNLAIALAGIAANLDQSDDDFIDVDTTNNQDQSADDNDLIDLDDQSTDNSTDNSDTDLIDFDDQSTDNSDDDLLDVDVPITESFNDQSDDDNNGANRDNDYSTNVDDTLNDNGDNRDNDYSTDVDLDVEDALNDNGNNRDNNNGDDRNNDQSDDDGFDLDLALEDAFNVDDDDIIDIDALTGGANDILTAGNDLMSNTSGVAVFGDGVAFEVDQTNTLADQDVLNNPTVTNNALNAQGGFAGGGESDATSEWGDAGNDANVAADAVSSADGVVSSEAFTQNIVMGANVQYNSVDMSVVGGSGGGEAFGDDA